MILRILSIILLSYLTEGSEDEYRLIQDLRQNYDPIERPVRNHADPIHVNLSIILQQLVDVDEKNQILTLVVWTQSTWNDYKMRWDPLEYGNITSIQLPNNFLWKPDILLFNSADEHFDASFPVNFVVQHTGDILLAPPGIVKISCELNMTWFPFDEQLCHLKYGSWTYNGVKLDLHIHDSSTRDADNQMDLSYYIENGEFELLSTPAKRKESVFNEVKYVELYYYMHLKRKTLYYGLNWIIPSILISLSNVMGFTMPPECGEKITLQITNLLSVTVFLGMVSEVTPPTSGSIPIIAAFFSLSMLILGCSIIATIVIINVYFRSPKMHKMSKRTRFIFLEFLPWLLLMQRPGKIFTRSRTPKSDSHCTSEASQSSLSPKIIARIDEVNEVLIHNGPAHYKPKLVEETDILSVYTPLESGMRDVVSILHSMKEKLEENEAEDEGQDDWRFMAMVIDRLCLFFFTILIAGTTLMVFVFTPQIANYPKFW